jgi:hypothetical protein
MGSRLNTYYGGKKLHVLWSSASAPISGTEATSCTETVITFKMFCWFFISYFLFYFHICSFPLFCFHSLFVRKNFFAFKFRGENNLLTYNLNRVYVCVQTNILNAEFK